MRKLTPVPWACRFGRVDLSIYRCGFRHLISFNNFDGKLWLKRSYQQHLERHPWTQGLLMPWRQTWDSLCFHEILCTKNRKQNDWSLKFPQLIVSHPMNSDQMRSGSWVDGIHSCQMLPVLHIILPLRLFQCSGSGSQSSPKASSWESIPQKPVGLGWLQEKK